MKQPQLIQRRLLRTSEASRYLNLSPWKLRKLIAFGKLPVFQDQDGAPFLLDIEDLNAYIAAHKHTLITPL